MDLYGPVAGRHHDMIMVRESNINGKVRDVQIGNDVVVPGIPGLRAVPDLVTIHPILPPTVHIQPYHD